MLNEIDDATSNGPIEGVGNVEIGDVLVHEVESKDVETNSGTNTY